MNTWVWKQVMKHQGEPVLALTLRRPELPTKRRGTRRVARYYQRLGEAWRTRWETALYPMACQALDTARAQSRPFQPWSAELDFVVTLERDDCLSLYLDATERGPAPRPLTVRSADTWSLPGGFPVALSALLPRDRRWRRAVLQQVEAQIACQADRGESLFFPDAPQRLRAAFSPHRFYRTEQALHVFFPMLSIGAAAEGIPTFPLFSP